MAAKTRPCHPRIPAGKPPAAPACSGTHAMGAPPFQGWGTEPLVLTRRIGSSLVVEHVDGRAQQFGLRAGMTLGQAQAIAPELLPLEHEPWADRVVLERLAHWALRFSPIVQAVEPDTLLLDITGCRHLFSGEFNLARQAHDGLRRQGFHTRAAVADTVGAACALATASGEAVVVASEGQAGVVLAPLPPAALRIDARVAERLDALGLRTIGDLSALPRASLPARFGSQLVLRLQQALGEVYEEVTAHAYEQPPAARIAFDAPLSDFQTIQVVAAQLLEALFTQLRQRTLALQRIDCVLIHEHAPPAVLAISLSRASRAWRHIGELVRRRLETADLSAGLVGLRLVARETSRFRPGQIDLFEPHDPGSQEQLGCLLDRLINRLGPAAVVQAELVDDYQPERAFRYRPVNERAGHRGKRSAEASAARGSRPDSSAVRRGGLPRNNKRVCPSPRPIHVLPEPMQALPQATLLLPRRMPSTPRPMQVFPRPLPIRVIALVPDGPPTWLALRGREYVVVRAWGPERIETGWWRGPDIRRDYFRAAVETGEQFWIFRRAGDGQWYLHGVFA